LLFRSQRCFNNHLAESHDWDQKLLESLPISGPKVLDRELLQRNDQPEVKFHFIFITLWKSKIVEMQGKIVELFSSTIWLWWCFFTAFFVAFLVAFISSFESNNTYSKPNYFIRKIVSLSCSKKRWEKWVTLYKRKAFSGTYFDYFFV